MTTPSDEPSEDPGPQVFDSIAARLSAPGQPGGHFVQEVASRLEALTQALGEKWIGGPWNPDEDDVQGHTAGYLDAQQEESSRELEGMLSDWAQQLDGDDPIHMLLYFWWHCFLLQDRTFAYRTIDAVVDAVAKVTANGAREGWSRWQRDTWDAVGAAMRLMQLNGLIFAQINLSAAEEVQRLARDVAAGQGAQIQAQLRGALAQLEELPAETGAEIRLGVAYILGYTDQGLLFCGVIEETAAVLIEFENWVAGPVKPKRHGAASPALRSLSLADAPRARVVKVLRSLDEAKRKCSSYILSEMEPWEQMLIGLLDLMPDRPHHDTGPSVLIPLHAWVRYSFPFAVQDDDGKRARALLHVQPGTRHPLTARLREELSARGDLGQLRVGEPVDMADTQFFHVGTSDDRHYGGIRIPLHDLTFVKDFLGGAPRPYKAWLDLNRMGNFCLCVEAAEPLKDIPPSRLYRALRAGTPFVFGEPVALFPEGTGDDAGHAPQWDNLNIFSRCLIKAAADAYFFATRQEARDAPPGSAHYVRANLHEIVMVQTEAPVAIHSADIASRLDDAVGGRILLRSLQRPAGTLEEWTRFPPLQRVEQRPRASALLTVPEIGYAGDWLVHTGETTVFGVVAVPSWLRDCYPEAAQFAGSWAPVLQLWDRRLQKTIADLREKPDAATGASSEELRNVEQEVRRHLAEIRAESLCATRAYRRFLDSLLDAAGIGRLEEELEAQLQAAEQLTDYFYQRAEQEHRRTEREYQKKEQEVARRRDILLFFIALFGVFGLSDFLALVDGTDAALSGSWEDLMVLSFFGAALVGGVYVLFRDRLREWLPKMRKKS